MRSTSIGIGWGLSIVMLTLIVRILLLPLTLKQFKSMQSMARHQPELKRMQEKYKDDKDRLNQELMKFYRENKINPLASCLPLLAQLPVFISLFYMLRKDLRLDICPEINPHRHGQSEGPAAVPTAATPSFLFIPNLTDKADGGVLVTLIILYVGSQLVSTVMSTFSADKTQRYIMYGAAVLLRGVRLPVPGRPAPLLDHDEPLDDRAADDRPQARLGPLRPPPDPDADAARQPEGCSSRLPAAARRGGVGATSDRQRLGRRTRRRPTGPPPAPPRKKKKRSGRRR